MWKQNVCNFPNLTNDAGGSALSYVFSSHYCVQVSKTWLGNTKLKKKKNDWNSFIEAISLCLIASY